MNTECVILAAGLSSRVGENKMMLKLNEIPVIEHCVGAFYDFCSKIIVVTGYYHEETAKALQKHEKVRIVRNKNYRQGMFCSVKTGIKLVEAERFFITPGDYPLLKKETINRMLWVDSNFLVPVFKGIQGHPILLRSTLISFILAAETTSLRACLKNTPRKELNVDDSGIITDLDTYSDYEKINASFQS